MHADDLVRYYNGMVNWIYSQNVDIEKPQPQLFREYNTIAHKKFLKYDFYLHKIILRFGKENNLKMVRENGKGYRGKHRPILHNCEVVQENWDLFKKWVLENYKSESEFIPPPKVERPFCPRYAWAKMDKADERKRQEVINKIKSN